MLTYGRLSKQFLGATVAALLTAGGTASAQSAPSPWHINGSDTLEHITRDSIAAAEAGGFLAPNLIIYDGGGSTTGENAMLNNKQSIAPMSRNVKGTAFTLYPVGVRNVVALDAAVIITRNTSQRCRDLSQMTLFNDTASATQKATPNDTASATYTNLLEVVLSGVDGSGSVAACSDPRRIAAIQDLAACEGSLDGVIDTFYRRDDNSGTTDTFKDKVAVQRFCNGAARGILGTNTTNPNLNNQDLDPIRRPCKVLPNLPDGSPQKAITCTNISTGAFCTPADNAAFPGCELNGTCPCTHGLVVAVSGGDNATTLSDVTLTIAARVAVDANSQTFGYAGRESVRQPAVANTAAPTIKKTSFADATIRLDSYLLSRRLFLQRAAANTDTWNDSDPATGGGAAQAAAEQALYSFMTDPDGSENFDGSVGACNIRSIVKARGFITCTDDCTIPPSGSSNLCSRLPFPQGPSFPGACVPNSNSGGPAWGYGEVACTAGSTCCSTGAACPASLVCPAAAGRPSGAACSQNSECASGTCTDLQGIGILQCQ